MNNSEQIIKDFFKKYWRSDGWRFTNDSEGDCQICGKLCVPGNDQCAPECEVHVLMRAVQNLGTL